MKMKILKYISSVIFIICLPALLLSASLAWGFNSAWLYNYGFEKYNVSYDTGISSQDLDKAGHGLINYFNSTQEYVNIQVSLHGKTINLFTEEEQIHFKDVKVLIWLDYKVLLVTLILVLAYFGFFYFFQKGRFRRLFLKSLLWGSGLSILLIIAIGVASFFDFDALFLQFHYLAFTNMFWSAEGYMLRLFPGGFWYDAFFIMIAFMVFWALVAGVLALVLLRRKTVLKGNKNSY
jgi:integral membrane protein (TIGR01906 family)